MIHHKDALDFLKSLPENSIDLVVTEPPIMASYYEDYMFWQIDVINACLRVLKPEGTLCYCQRDFIGESECISPLRWIYKSSAVLRQRVTWERGGSLKTEAAFYQVEGDIYILGKERVKYPVGTPPKKYSSLWKLNSDGPKCADSFPLDLPFRCIETFTSPGMVVLDPFMGYGTTAVAAQRAGRNYLGSDLCESRCDQARKRLADDQLSLFG